MLHEKHLKHFQSWMWTYAKQRRRTSQNLTMSIFFSTSMYRTSFENESL